MLDKVCMKITESIYQNQLYLIMKVLDELVSRLEIAMAHFCILFPIHKSVDL